MYQKYFLENFTNFSFFTSAKKKQFKTTSFSGMVSLFFLLVCLFGNSVYAQNFTDNTPGTRTFTVPCGVTSITVEAWGGGGAGGGTTDNNAKGGGGGAGGTYASSTLTVSPGQTIDYTVGAGGVGADSAGTIGQASWFSTTGTLYAQGGVGGEAPNGGTVAGGIGSITTSIGTTRLAGVNGGSGTATLGAAGGAGGNSGGAGGGTRNTENDGRNGTAPGGGGGGAFVTDNSNHSGGNGGNGQISITYTSAFQNYCIPNFTSAIEPITNITFAGINNTTSATVNVTPANETFCTIANVIQGSATNTISIKGNTVGNYTDYIRVFIDWDQNGVYGNVANESYYLGTITNSTGIDAITLVGNIAVPATATLGNTRMRVMKRWDLDPTNPCGVYTWGQSEEYTVNVAALVPTISSFTPGSGCTGSTITITGTNLTGATAVTIGGTAASISTNTATQITAVVGSGTTGTVIVTTSGGTASSVGNFTVNPTPAAIAGGATTVCVGSTTAFTNTTAGGIWSVTNVTGSATITASGIVTGVTPGTVTVVYTLGSCSVNKTLAVNANSAAIGGGAATVCSGATTPAYTNATSGGTWTIINGAPGSATITAGGIVTGVTPGTVTIVYTISGCSTTKSLTINPTPAAIAGGATTVCVGSATAAFTNATAGGTWSVTAGTGSATITAGGIVTGITAGNVTINYTLGTCSVNTALVITVAPLAAVTPAPANTGTGICYAGSGAITNVSWAVSAGATSYDVYFGAGSLPGVVTATAATNSYSTGTLLANTTYYWQVVANNNCSSAAGAVWTFTTAASPCLSYCTPNYTTAVNPITNVNFAGINNTTSNVINGTPVFEIFTSPTGTVEQGETYAISVSGNTNGNVDYGVKVYFDWNQNGLFTDSGEDYTIGVINNSASGPAITNAIVVPIGATVGNTRMRIMFANGIYSASCTSGAYSGQAEDYTVLVTPVTCLRPTALVASAITATTATVSWTAPSPAPGNGYDYFITTFNSTPNSAQVPTGSVGTGITTVNLTGLTTGLTYYVWVRGNCGGSDHSVWSTQLQFTTSLSNNDCAGAIPLTVNTGTTCVTAAEGTTAGASQTLAGCTGNADDDVWYSFTATTASHIVTVVPGTITNPVFQVFRTSCAGTSIVCVNATSATSTETTTLTGLTAGATYWVRVYSSGGNWNQGTFTICVTTVPPTYCAPTSAMSDRYINSYQTVGPLDNTVNLNTGRSATGYHDYTALPAATQVPLGGINIDIVFAVSRQYLKAWVDWNGNGVFTDAAPELVYTSGGVQSIATSFGFVIPSGTAPGNYRLRVRSYEASQTFDSCGYLDTGETEDYTITVIPDCALKITSVTDGSRCESGTVNLVAVGSGSPTEYRWYDAENGGSLIGTTPTGNCISPVISTTTNYYVTAYNGTCESLVRTKIIAKINSSSVINVTPSTPEVCGEGNTVTVTATGDTMVEDLINEDFEGAGLGSLSSVLISGAGDALTQWQKKASTFIPVGSVWKPAISSRDNGNNFAFTTSDYNLDVNAALESATFNTVPYSDLTLTFRHFYSYYGVPYDGAYLEASTNGGTTWVPVLTYTSNQGVATKFETVTVNLNAYVNQPTFQLRFRYNARFCDGWAIDDVRLFGTKPMNTTFTWSGATVAAFVDSLCTIPYTAQSVTTVYVKPTPAQMTAPSWSFTATATLGNGCPVSKLITVDNKTRFWQGTNSVSPTNWGLADNWLPAVVPDATNCVIIPNHTIITGTGTNGYAKNLTVKSTGILDIESDSNLTVKEWVNVNTGGIFNMKNNASLIQIDNVPNIGIIKMERKTQPMYRYDYTYWGSPLTQASGFTVGNLSSGSSLRYSWTPSVGGLSGNWAGAAASTVMTAAKGYIVRAPDSFSTNPAIKVPYTATFIGTPNNGDLSIPITFGAMGPSATNDKWNLISNPYPSAIDAGAFLSEVTNQTLLDGTIYFWTHNSPPSNITPDPFYGDFAINYTANDYASWNRMGGTGTQALTFGPSPTSYIAAGSAFFVKSLGVSGNAAFTNSMRVSDNNNQFYRTANPMTQASPSDDFEKHRIWLNLTNNSGAFNQILVGYAEGATLGMDRDFDGTRFGGNGVTLYSILPEANLGIQGRPLPFDVTDKVILGFNAAAAGTFSVRIDHVDGLFNTQNIYLEDKLLQIVHNLKLAPYVFTTAAGNFNNRFVLRYTESTLGTDTFDVAHTVKVTVNEKVTVHASNLLIKEITVFDLLGRKIDTYKNVGAKEFTLNHLNKTNNVLILKITLENDAVVTEKIIF